MDKHESQTETETGQGELEDYEGSHVQRSISGIVTKGKTPHGQPHHKEG